MILRERARGLRCQRLHLELEEDISLTSIPQPQQSAPTLRHRISVLVMKIIEPTLVTVSQISRAHVCRGRDKLKLEFFFSSKKKMIFFHRKGRSGIE